MQMSTSEEPLGRKMFALYNLTDCGRLLWTAPYIFFSKGGKSIVKEVGDNPFKMFLFHL